MQRRTFLKLSTAWLFLPCSELSAQAPYPGRPIEIVIPLPPGGPTDAAPRIFIEYLRPRLKATFVPVNKPGAGGAIVANDQDTAAAITKARMTAEYGSPAHTRALLDKERSIVAKLAQQVQLGE
jgi:tripartite-type tricarboxylate transporter receptor subunit TctC